MLLRLYDVTRSTIQFHEKSLPAQENRTSVSKQIRSWVGFFSSVVNCLTNPFSQKNAIELFTLVLTNINCILQADFFFFGGGEERGGWKQEISLKLEEGMVARI